MVFGAWGDDPSRKVVLFGSWGRGTHTVGSDVDLLVVYRGEPRSERLRPGEARAGDPASEAASVHGSGVRGGAVHGRPHGPGGHRAPIVSIAT
jgi:hypothetical protein